MDQTRLYAASLFIFFSPSLYLPLHLPSSRSPRQRDSPWERARYARRDTSPQGWQGRGGADGENGGSRKNSGRGERNEIPRAAKRLIDDAGASINQARRWRHERRRSDVSIYKWSSACFGDKRILIGRAGSSHGTRSSPRGRLPARARAPRSRRSGVCEEISTDGKEKTQLRLGATGESAAYARYPASGICSGDGLAK